MKQSKNLSDAEERLRSNEAALQEAKAKLQDVLKTLKQAGGIPTAEQMAKLEQLNISFFEAPVFKRSEEVIYFISDSSGAIKIGLTRDPNRRLKSLLTGSSKGLTLLATIPGGMDAERELHIRFAADRIRGEWFSPSDALRSYINGIVKTGKN